MQAGLIRTIGEHLVLDGVYGTVYRIDTVDEIDANLDSMRFHPDHPDIDRLLDARRIVSVLNWVWPEKIPS
ncbi:hypothetical protein ACFWPQ_01505 [Streptomyces sp. NPDC058464]|uniref:hypothetical protein n=1 Tax=Streptomyces sp. NPDC058464 TaxID=3346511 RepID=UPI003649AE98